MSNSIILKVPTLTGYKATTSSMKCRDVKFTLGKWSAPVDGELIPCENGYHFCTALSGVFNYYNGNTARVFKIEAEDVVIHLNRSGTATKCVCRRIRLVEEITVSAKTRKSLLLAKRSSVARRNNTGRDNVGHGNTGSRNTGYANTGHDNTGDRNTGDLNTGGCNSGSCNSGNGNSGNGNTGSCNIGSHNSGNCNIGSHNSGNYNIGYLNSGNDNIGDGNTGYRNTGNGNTGNCNIGDYNVGTGNVGNKLVGVCCCGEAALSYFCVSTGEPKVKCFGKSTGLTEEQFRSQFGSRMQRLQTLLQQPEPIPFKHFSDIPNITPKKLERLHALIMEGVMKAKATEERHFLARYANGNAAVTTGK